jgi:phosphoglycolate phosphatase-like HAD superfamily hydrolase
LTRNVEQLVYLTLEESGLLPYFSTQYIIARDTCTPKPSPVGIFKICQMWGIEPKNAVMVGDYLYDIQAGFEAGSQTILIQRGQDQDQDQDQDSGFTPQTAFAPHIEIHSFLELL